MVNELIPYCTHSFFFTPLSNTDGRPAPPHFCCSDLRKCHILGPRLPPKRFLIGTEATETVAAWEENFAGRYWRLGEERQPLSAWHQNSDGDIATGRRATSLDVSDLLLSIPSHRMLFFHPSHMGKCVCRQRHASPFSTAVMARWMEAAPRRDIPRMPGGGGGSRGLKTGYRHKLHQTLQDSSLKSFVHVFPPLSGHLPCFSKCLSIALLFLFAQGTTPRASSGRP